MNVHKSFGAAALAAVAVAAAPSAKAQEAHRYVSVATTTLPEPGDPLAVIFVDTGAVKRTGDTAAFELVYALGKPQAIRGTPTSHVVFRYEANCKARSVRTVGYSTYPPAGAPKVTTETGQMRPAVAGSVDDAILKLVCEPSNRAGYASLDQVTLHAHNFERAQRELNRTVPHSIVFLGAGTSQVMGNFLVFADLGTAERAGDQATVQVVEAFLQSKTNDPTAGAFIINTVTYACSTQTQVTSFTSMYAASGAPLKATLTGAQSRPVRAGTLDERAMNVACTRTVPAGTTPPFTNLSEALNAGWKALAAPRTASATPAKPAPAAAPAAAPKP